MGYDLVIRNGFIVDGTGAKGAEGALAVKDGKIAAVGKVAGGGARELDAQGAVVAPGFVDIHTHYDGQASWDSELGPSAWHGVTSLVMGNCGVGFAPARPDRHDWLIGLMEGVEDIPGTALAEGMSWQWESFPQYLDALEKMPHTLDIATQIPHGAVRAYVMGERGANNEAANADDIEAMARLVEEGLRAGALGFSTSRTMLHVSRDKVPVPGSFANRDELLGIGRAMARAGHGIFEMASDLNPLEEEFAWIRDLSCETGVPVSYALLQSPADAQEWRRIMRLTEDAVAAGAKIRPQIALRPTGLLLGWRSSVHPFSFHPSYRKIMALPFAEQLRAMRDESFRAALLREEPDFSGIHAARGQGGKGDKSSLAPPSALLHILTAGFERMFRLRNGGGLDYEPAAETSIEHLARAKNCHPRELLYDILMEKDGQGYIYLPLLNYAEFNLDHVYELMQHPLPILGLSDGGAHCGVICDASFPTYLLTHWVRDRKRGRRLPLEQAISRQTRDTAQFYGLCDRGVLAEGMRADINIIDLPRLDLGDPEMVFDLPAGGKRLIQRAKGYAYTICRGEVTFADGEPTGALPGRLVRGPQSA